MLTDWIGCACFEEHFLINYRPLKVFVNMALKIASTNGSTRKWSCSTLEDGVDAVIRETQKIEDEEEEMMKLIQDQPHTLIYVHSYTVLFVS